MSSGAILLLNAPYGDFTYPYHSLSYVAPELKSRGYSVDVLDMSAEWFRSCFTRSWLEHTRGGFLAELEELAGLDSLDLVQQARLLDLAKGLAAVDVIEPEKAVEILQGEAFFDYRRYHWARQHVRLFEQVLDSARPPYRFSTAFASPPFYVNASRTVTCALSAEAFMGDVERLLRQRCGSKDYFLIGVSVPFEAQLLLGCATLAAAGRVFPGARRVLGGTAITDLYKNARSHAVLRTFAPCCDDLFVGEAESAIGDYADHCSTPGVALPREVISLRSPHVALGIWKDIQRPQTRFAQPDYSWINWDLYLSPERQVNYSPARGCFWNKCTFCDYGLNVDTPAAPYRRSSPEGAVEDMAQLLEAGIENVYLAVDAIDPVFLKRFSRGLLEKGLKVDWSAELFLTDRFDAALIGDLEASGLVTASFGFESGSDRVLELMGKGPNRNSKVHEVVFSRLRQSKIGLQPKYFFGFPTETRAERSATLEVLTRHAGVFCVLTKPNVFDLTMGSMIAKDPSRFGVRRLWRRSPDDDIGGALDYELEDGTCAMSREEFVELGSQIAYPPEFERPWAGGIDTFHTKLYVKRFGRGVFRQLRESIAEGGLPRLSGATQVSVPFNLASARENTVVSAIDVNELTRLTNRDGSQPGVLREALEEAAAPLKPLARPRSYTVRVDVP